MIKGDEKTMKTKNIDRVASDHLPGNEKQLDGIPAFTGIEAGTIDGATASENALDGVRDDISAIDKTYIENAVIDVLRDYETIYNVDIESLKQIRFNHVLQYISDRIIKPLKIDYRNPYILYSISEVYISICRLCSKSVSLYGLSIFLNVDYRLLYSLKDNKAYSLYYDTDNNIYIDSTTINNYRYKYKEHKIIELPNNLFKQVCDKIKAEREHMLTDKTEDGSVMSLALGKIENGWIESQKEKLQVETMQKYQLPADILKKYSDN